MCQGTTVIEVNNGTWCRVDCHTTLCSAGDEINLVLSISPFRENQELGMAIVKYDCTAAQVGHMVIELESGHHPKDLEANSIKTCVCHSFENGGKTPSIVPSSSCG